MGVVQQRRRAAIGRGGIPKCARDRQICREGVGRITRHTPCHHAPAGKSGQHGASTIEAETGGGIVSDTLDEGDVIAAGGGAGEAVPAAAAVA